MFADWVTRGVGVGIEICAAAFTVIVVAGLILGLLGLGAKILKEVDDENERFNRPRPL